MKKPLLLLQPIPVAILSIVVVCLFFNFYSSLAMQALLIVALILSYKREKEEKQKYEIALQKVACRVSHDIRSPLATLNTTLDNLKDIPDEQAQIVEKSLERIHEISNSLSDNTSVVNIPKVVTTNINHLVRGVIHQKVMKYRNDDRIKLSHCLPVEELNSFLDPIEFRRIIINLIRNSIEALKNNFIEIHIQLRSENDQLIITVTDNGAGIEEKTLALIGQQEISTKPAGIGLSLFHAIESIKGWRGNFHVDSTLNQGTKITIALPAVIGPIQKTILVDDDEIIRQHWSTLAKKKLINFVALKEPHQLTELTNTLTNDTIFYIDSELRNGVKGEDVAQTLYLKGFTEIYIITELSKDYFTHLTFIKGVRAKTPPWN